MAFEINCKENRKNTGVQDFCKDIGVFVKFKITPPNFEMSEADAKDETKWLEAIHKEQKDRVYPFPLVMNMTDNTEDTVYNEGATGIVFVREGKVIFQFEIPSTRYAHAALKSHSNKKCGVVFVDEQNRLHGVRKGDNFAAIKLQRFTVEKLSQNEGAISMVSMVLEDSYQYQAKPAIIATDFDTPVKDMAGLVDLMLTAGVATTSLIPVTVKSEFSGEAFEGALADFEVRNSAGVVQAITTVTYQGDGLHNLNFTTPLTPGIFSVNLVKPADMVTKGFESTGAITVTVA
jgi:hypothetical protein